MPREDKEALAAEHASAVLDLQQRMAAAAEEAEARYTELHQQYVAIKARYDAREPREEDVLRIRQVWPGAGQGGIGEGIAKGGCRAVRTHQQMR